MSLLDDVTQVTNTGATTTPKTVHKTADTLDINDFLTLMSAQLQNQDPLKPLDSTAFVAQLAQFGTVSGVQGMQTSLNTLSTALRSSQMLSGASLVGHEITAAATDAHYKGTGAIGGEVDVPEGSLSVTVNVTDSTGQVVRHLAIDPASGTQTFSWDGKSDSGAQLAAGTYKFAAISSTSSANTSLQTYLNGKVGSVSLGTDGVSLTVHTSELGATDLSTVREIT
jgi:flagellar basal-body rod modification protein FlgD